MNRSITKIKIRTTRVAHFVFRVLQFSLYLKTSILQSLFSWICLSCTFNKPIVQPKYLLFCMFYYFIRNWWEAVIKKPLQQSVRLTITSENQIAHSKVDFKSHNCSIMFNYNVENFRNIFTHLRCYIKPVCLQAFKK